MIFRKHLKIINKLRFSLLMLSKHIRSIKIYLFSKEYKFTVKIIIFQGLYFKNIRFMVHFIVKHGFLLQDHRQKRLIIFLDLSSI